MTWDYYGTGENFVYKAERKSPDKLLDTLNPKQKKRLKKLFSLLNHQNFLVKTLRN